MKPREIKSSSIAAFFENSSQKILHTFLSFLDSESLSVLEVVSKAHLRVIRRKSQPGPYLNFDHFKRAFSGYFTDKWTCWYAWLLYKETIENRNNPNPAAIFSRKDKNEKISHEEKQFKKDDPSRVYTPGFYNHSWEFNLAWILAQVQIGRPFKILSEPQDQYFFQSKRPRVVRDEAKYIYSGYALEISAAIKANYVIKKNADGLLLVPTLSPEKRVALTIDDIYPTKQDVENAMGLLKQSSNPEEAVVEQGQARKRKYSSNI